MFRKYAKKIFLISALAFVFALISFSAVHAQLGADVVGSQTGLGNGDIRAIIGRIIQVALGLLGVVALGLVLYSGFTWMTAGGDEEKVATAKRILSQAIIGLVIILSAFSITTYVVNNLLAATGADGTGTNPPGGDIIPPITTSDFMVSAINPPDGRPAGTKFPKNVQVAIVFKNGSPDPTTTTAGTISITTGGASIVGTVTVNGNTAIWKPTTACEENSNYFCLPADSVFHVSISSSVKSLTGRPLICGLCSANFETGNYIDTAPPTVAITSPVNNQSVPVNSLVSIFSNATDDSAVATVGYSANSAVLGSVGFAPWKYDWNTTGIAPGTNVALKALATDLAGNTASSADVNVILRPIHCFNGVKDSDETGLDCGGSCGACPGDSCNIDADCFSGICFNNICVDKPRIDSVDPLSGGPGTYVTINGAGFGSVPGRVIFTGTDAIGDEKVTTACAPSAWTNNEVIVAVPDGAVSGALELVTNSNGSDRTDDTFGALVSNFTITNIVLPGICTLSPDTGGPGTSIAINGIGFGDNQGTNEADFADRSANVSAWTGAKITALVPNLLSGIWPVRVKVGETLSNGVSFSVPLAAGVPHIIEMNPISGPVGEYITITGVNFGDTQGRVNFVQGTDTYLGKTDFPEACSKIFWHNNSITVKAPAGGTIGNYTVRVVTVSGVPSDNTKDFSLGGGTPKPGLCRIDPSAGPVGSKFTLYGERLGSSSGTVTFTKNKNVNTFSAWNDGQISGAVSGAATTGSVTATEVNGQTSNSVLFAVGNCKTANICEGGTVCCDNGTCRGPKADGSSACAPTRYEGAYAYRFSTGTIPLVPHVIDDFVCDKYTQSPSPYLGTKDACINALVSVRFDIGMNDATLVPANFNIYSCGTDEQFDSAKCSTTSVKGLVQPFGASQPIESGMNFIADANFAKNTWFKAVVSKNVASVAAVNMDEDYVWTFRTRDSLEPCALAGVNVSPAENLLTDIWKVGDGIAQKNITYSDYLASPHAANCNAVKCDAYGWNWTNEQINSVWVVGNTNASGVKLCTAVARALQETAVSPDKIIASATDINNASKVLGSGNGLLTVKFTDPVVKSFWPNCDKACLEAEVGAEFNTAMNAGTMTKNNVKLFSCTDETCQTTTDLGAAVNYSDTSIHVVTFPGVSLATNKYYLVRITNNVKSSAGVSLTGTNSMWNGFAVFAWSFRVGTDHCKVAAVGINPPLITTNIIGEYDSLTAMPITSPDSCSASGQKIDPFKISDWTWKIEPKIPPATSAGSELYKNGALNVRPVNSLYVTSNCLKTGSEAPRPVCGNGVVEDGAGKAKSWGAIKGGGGGGEECDLGNGNDAAGTPTDGSSGSGCSANCLFTGARTLACSGSNSNCCGDSVTQGVCQPGVIGFVPSANPVACSADKPCANGFCRYDVPGAEQCDVGTNNGKAGSGCSTRCLSLGSNSVTPKTTCGNNDLAFNEQCDNGFGAGCSSECLDEGSMPGISVCGNSRVEDGEDCDAGANNGKAGSGCSAVCLHTGTPVCSGLSGSVCCGNTDPDPGEDVGCDQGLDLVTKQPIVAQGCDLSCRKIGSSFYYSTPSVCADSQLGLGETADPGSKDLFPDPTQYSHTIGIGNPDPASKAFTSTVTAATGGVSGTGTIKLQCGYTQDNQCSRDGLGNQTYVGYNTCCYGAPKIVSVIPVDTSAFPPATTPRVCRNPYILISFDRLLDEKTVPGKVTVGMTQNCKIAQVPASSQGLMGFVQKISVFLNKVWRLVAGDLVKAQVPNCKTSGSIKILTEYKTDNTPYTALQFMPDQALAPMADYYITVYGLDGEGVAGIRGVDGVAMQTSLRSKFSTGTDICTLDEVLINTDPVATKNMDTYLFSDITKLSETFNAIPIHREGSTVQAIAPIANVYSWSWKWNAATTMPAPPPDINLVTANGTLNSQVVTVNDATKTGEAAVTAVATIDVDTLTKPKPSTPTKIAGQTTVTVMMCQAPWPAGSGATWAPWPMSNADGTKTSLPNNKFNFSFFYCRDNGTGAKLPELGNPVMSDNPTPDFLRQYLLTYVGDTTHKTEGIGLRIAANTKWLSPTAYFASRGFTGSPQSLKIAGYNAVQDGRTVYANAPNFSTTYKFFPNIYILSYSDGAGTDTQNIFSQLKNNLRFNTNISGLNFKYCAKSGGSCTTDEDCKKIIPSNPADFCTTSGDELRRDTKRFEDMSTLAQAVTNVKNKTNAYPQLAAGTYMTGYSFSKWPSWSAEFATEIGASPPADPLNYTGTCNEAGYDKATCWNEALKQFFCPQDANMYGYSTDAAAGFNLIANFETERTGSVYEICPYTTNAACFADPLCYVVGTNCVPRLNSDTQCNGSTIGTGNNVCGDGVVGSNEECEKNQTQSVTCGTNAFAIQTCDATCRWQSGACQAVRCGNGAREGFCANLSLCTKNSDCADNVCNFAEACDEGKLNGTYNHCNASCTGYSTRCGDGVLDTGEKCDLGAANGQYDSGCSLDCQGKAPYCGDLYINGSETCDGGSEQRTTGCTKNADGIQLVSTRTCNLPGAAAACSWGSWGACGVPVGVGCGNGKTEGNEQCDDGGNNGIHNRCLPTCKLAVCGDGFLKTGTEECDSAGENVRPTDTVKIAELSSNCKAATCTYCTNACTIGVVTGGFCGDGVIQSGEQCDNDGGNVGGDEILYCDDQTGATCEKCSLQCKKVFAPYCGDGIVNGGEGCDAGAGNDIPGSGCSNTCECSLDIIASNKAPKFTVTNDPNYTTGAVPVTVYPCNPGWSKIEGAACVWGEIVDAGSTVKHYYFKYEFTLAKPSRSATIQISADNAYMLYVDGSFLDKHGYAMEGNSFLDLYTWDLDLSGGLTHTIKIDAYNVYNGQGSAGNPAGLWFRVISTPDCSKNVAARCGDGVVNGQEECDGNDFGGKISCKDWGDFDDGSISCSNSCSVVSSGCRNCVITLTGKIIDGQSSKGVPNQPILAYCGETKLAESTSNTNGRYSINIRNNAELDKCSRIVKLVSTNAQGYCFDPTSQSISVDLNPNDSCSKTVAVNDILVITQEPLPGKYTFVLTWGATPTNLDIHLKETNTGVYPGQAACSYSEAKAPEGRHVIAPCTYGNQARRCVVNGVLDQNKVCTNNDDCSNGSPCACLVVDNGNLVLDTDGQSGFGPEAITVTAHDDIRGFVYVNSPTAQFTGSKAQVKTWGNGCTVNTYSVESADNYGTSGRWWEVFNFRLTNGQMNFSSRGNGSGGLVSTSSGAPQWDDPAIICP